MQHVAFEHRSEVKKKFLIHTSASTGVTCEVQKFSGLSAGGFRAVHEPHLQHFVNKPFSGAGTTTMLYQDPEIMIWRERG